MIIQQTHKNYLFVEIVYCFNKNGFILAQYFVNFFWRWNKNSKLNNIFFLKKKQLSYCSLLHGEINSFRFESIPIPVIA